MQKGFALPLLLGIVLLVLLGVGGGYYFGQTRIIKESKDSEVVEQQVKEKLNNIKLPFNEETSIEEQEAQKREDEKLKNIKSNKDLPDIAKSVIEYSIKDNDMVPIIEFVSNDGEYATVSVHFLGYGGGHLAWLVKRNNQWIVVTQGNGYPSCDELNPLRTKYNLSKNFLKCAEEL